MYYKYMKTYAIPSLEIVNKKFGIQIETERELYEWLNKMDNDEMDFWFDSDSSLKPVDY